MQGAPFCAGLAYKFDFYLLRTWVAWKNVHKKSVLAGLRIHFQFAGAYAVHGSPD